MIFVGLDDTDVAGAPGTNKLARRLASILADEWHCRMILRHQLLVDDRIPYTSKNSSATMALESIHEPADVSQRRLDQLFDHIAAWLRQSVPMGSDPGLCVGRAEDVVPEVREFGRHCQTRICTRAEAEHVANRAGLRCAGLAGSELGVIGAVAALGLAATGNDGRLVMIDGTDDLSGVCSIAHLRARRVEVRCRDTGEPVHEGEIDVGKHLRPNWRSGRIIQYATAQPCVVGTPPGHAQSRLWTAVRLP